MGGLHRRPISWARRLVRIVAGSSLLGALAAILTPAAPRPVLTAAAADPGPPTDTLPAIPAAMVEPEPATQVFAAPTAAAAAARAAAAVETGRRAERERAAREAAADARARADIRAGTAVPTTSRTTGSATSARTTGSAGAPPAAAGQATRARIVAAARSYVDRSIPYRYGGDSLTAGMDCSHLVARILRDAGLSVGYRNSTALATWTARVAKASAQPGDLVLYPGHVGVYVGGGMMIDHGGPGAGANLKPVWGSPSYGRIPLT